jgi:hypothetical protein
MASKKNLKSSTVDDLLGTPAKTKKPKEKLDDLLGKTPRKKRTLAKPRTYDSLPVPKDPVPEGLFAAKEEKGKNLGRTCLCPTCKAPLKTGGRGRPPILCGKKDCFRWYRNAYRRDYDKARPS